MRRLTAILCALGAALALSAAEARTEKPVAGPLRDDGARAIQVSPTATLDPRRDYELAERVGTKDAWDAFLERHPSGFHAELARSQRDKIARSSPAGLSQVASAERPRIDSISQLPSAVSRITVLPPPGAERLSEATQSVVELTSPQPPAREIKILPAPNGEQRVLAAQLQTELRRVGCDPGATDGTWSARSRAAIEQFNRRAGTDFEVETATATALEAVRVQRGRICPLLCASGQVDRGDRCVAAPTSNKPQIRKDASHAPQPGPREPARKRAEKAQEPARERVRREQRFTPRPTARAFCPAGSSPMPQAGRMCCETTPERGAPRIFCP